MFDAWPCVITKKTRIKFNSNNINDNDTNYCDTNCDIEICYIQTYRDDNDIMSLSLSNKRRWISVSIEHDHIDNINRLV